MYRDIYSVRILWGNVFNAQNRTEHITNWSGGLTLKALGMLVLRHTISFEPGQDSILPVTDLHSIRWASATVPPDFDGIHTEVYCPMYDTGASYVPPLIFFETKQITIIIPVEELAELDTIIAVDEYSGVLIHARKVTSNCPQGFLAGYWLQKAFTEGRFFGRWIAIDGRLMGHYKGHFWTEDNGERKFRGKWIDNDGCFQGYLKGHWGYNNDPTITDAACCRGWFRGCFTDANGNPKGGLKGRFGYNCNYCTAANIRQNMYGTWWVYCPSLSSE